MKRLIWLDDIRDPFNDDWLTFIPEEGPFNTIWVKNYDEFTSEIEANGMPDIISFDHDLAPEHYTPPEYWGDYEKSKKYQERQIYTEKTGHSCAKWLINYSLNNHVKLPRYYVHSANPVGADNIRGVLHHYKTKFEDKRPQYFKNK